MPLPREDEEPLEPHVTVVRVGNGANCSSVGSVVDTLFVSAAVGGAIFAAICAAMKNEDVRVVGDPASAPPADDPSKSEEAGS